jgi:hypothetical protein
LTGPYVGMDRRSKWRRRIKEFLVEWWSGGVVEWWSGGVVEWWSGGVERGGKDRLKS